MYSRTNIKPTKVSGKNPAMTKDDYPAMRMKKTQQDLINEGKKFKHSVLKKPYVADLSYQEMEYEATPLGRGLDMTPLAQFPRFKGFDTVPLVSGGEASKYPCWCEGCTGAGGDTSAIWQDLEQAIEDGIIKTKQEIEAWVKARWPQVYTFTLPGVPTEYQCTSKGKETLYIYICGRRDEFVHLETTESDSLFVQSSFEVPFPNEGRCTTIDRCACHTIGVIIDCGAGFESCDTDRTVFLSACNTTQAIRIRPSTTACSSLTIVDEGGGAATDTILRNGSNDYSTTGDCCENITWSVGAGTGQLGGSVINQSGVLTAGVTACGSLLVTATCEACGTSDTQYVRVTDGGQWVLIDTITYGTGADGLLCTCISGKQKDIYYGSCCSTAGSTCDENGFTGWLQYTYLCSGTDGCTGCCSPDPKYGCIRIKYVYEWQC